MKNNELEIQGSLTGVVWLPFQAKYAHLYKYLRYRILKPHISNEVYMLPALSNSNS